MNGLVNWLHSADRFANALKRTLATGCLTIAVALLVEKTGNPYFTALADFLGGVGNDFFLIGTNILILVWAWRQRLRSVITLTLGIDLLVWLSVQGIKLLQISPWYLRPNGGSGGFPSGHATHAFAMAFLLTLFYPRFSWLWYTAAAAISWSRIETDWHTSFQVTAGIILGVFIAWAMIGRWLGHSDASAIQTAPAPGIQCEPVRVKRIAVAE